MTKTEEKTKTNATLRSMSPRISDLQLRLQLLRLRKTKASSKEENLMTVKTTWFKTTVTTILVLSKVVKSLQHVSMSNEVIVKAAIVKITQITNLNQKDAITVTTKVSKYSGLPKGNIREVLLEMMML